MRRLTNSATSAAAAAAANMGLLIDLPFREARLVSLAKRLVGVFTQ